MLACRRKYFSLRHWVEASRKVEGHSEGLGWKQFEVSGFFCPAANIVGKTEIWSMKQRGQLEHNNEWSSSLGS